jgi:sec-independent protein translocase protein TatA
VVLAEILGPDLLVILAIVALLFGSSRLPQLARSLGSAKSEFEKGIAEGHVDKTTPPPSVGAPAATTSSETSGTAPPG